MTISREAFQCRVLEMSGALHGVARHLTRNDADAEDLVAETLLRAWKARETLECEAAFRGWVFRILHNAHCSSCRRASVRPRLEPIAGDEPTEDGSEAFSIFEQLHQPFLLWFSNPEQDFLDKLLREDLDRALCALPEPYRLVVLLADVEEFSYQEIASMLDVPIGTVRSRLARARGMLQKMLWRYARSDRGVGTAGTTGPAMPQAGATATMRAQGERGES